MRGDDLAVGKQLTRVVEEDDTVAQQAPALFGMGGHNAGRFPVVRYGWWTKGLMRAHGEPPGKRRGLFIYGTDSRLNTLVRKSAVLGWILYLLTCSRLVRTP
jgi:hypothetical protein